LNVRHAVVAGNLLLYSPVKQYEFVNAEKTPISLEFSKAQRVAILSVSILFILYNRRSRDVENDEVFYLALLSRRADSIQFPWIVEG